MSMGASALRFEEAGHRYFAGDVQIPSVTSILQPYVDFSGIDPKVLERKRQIGKALHKATDLDERGDLVEESVDPAVLPYLHAWRKFKQETGWAVVASEVQLHHPIMKYAGTLDRVMKKPRLGTIAIPDIKTSPFYPTTPIQTAGYVMLWNYHKPAQLATERFSVHLKPDATYRLEPHRETALDMQTFKQMLAIHQFKERHGIK